MTNDTQDQSVLNRRLLLRGGAVVAGATAIAAAASVTNPRVAEAADGDQLALGAENEATKTTALRLSTASGTTPTLSLGNASGPSLRLSSVGFEFAGELQPGDVVNTDNGPLVGVTYDSGADFLATGRDLESLPTPFAIDPERLLDTRTAAGREAVVRTSSSSAITSAGKLRAGQWVDVAVGPTAGLAMSAVFVNATAVSSEKNGFLTVYAATATRPGTSNLNYAKGVTGDNSAFVGLGKYEQNYVVRIYSSQTTHVLLDLTGAVSAVAEATPGSDARSTGAARRAKKVLRMKKMLAR